MSDESVSLGLFGVIHMDDPEKVTSELRSFAADGGADAIFVEMPEEMISPRELLRSFLRAPFYFLGMFVIAVFLQWPLFVYYNGRPQATERIAAARLAEEHDVPIHGVDPTIRRLTAVGPLTTAANWLALGVLLSFAPLLYGVTLAATVGWALLTSLVVVRGHPHIGGVMALAAFGWLIVLLAGWSFWAVVPLVAGFFGFAVGAHQTLHDRNEFMLSRTAELAADHDYETAVLVTGKKHLHGLALLAAERSISVPAVHVSMWTDEGTRFTEFTPAELPGSVPGSGSKYKRSAILPGSQSSVRFRRAAASLLDLIPVLLCCVVLFDVVRAVVQSPLSTVGAPIDAVAALSTVALALVGYHAATEWYVGTTAGKDLLGLAVVGEDGEELSGRQALIRNLLRPVDAVGGYLLGGVAMLGTERSQRLGDLAAGTVVGRVDPPPAGEHSVPVPGAQGWRRHPTVAPRTTDGILGRRAAAAAFDLLLGTLLGLGVLVSVVLALPPTATFDTDVLSGPLELLVLVLPLLGVGAYHALAEWRYGTTLGKWKAGLVVAGVDGEPLTARQSLVRNVVRVFEAGLLHLPSLLAIGVSARSQRLGDMAAGTVVARTERAAAETDDRPDQADNAGRLDPACGDGRRPAPQPGRGGPRTSGRPQNAPRDHGTNPPPSGNARPQQDNRHRQTGGGRRDRRDRRR